jgi:hypothetical protein
MGLRGKIVKSNEELKILTNVSKEFCDSLGGAYVEEEEKCILDVEDKGDHKLLRRPPDVKVLKF